MKRLRLTTALAGLLVAAPFLAAHEPDKAAARDTELLAASRDAAVVKQGKATYVALCQACHGDEKTKVDSPSNLFDAKWYHGSRPTEIEHSVLTGFIDKGMAAWKDVLPPEDTTALTAYLLSFQKQ
jgi:cytochrome c oxidase cbb3-type subunit 3